MELTLKSTPEKYKKMVVELLPPLLELLHKFVLRLIDEKFYVFGDEKTWYVDML